VDAPEPRITARRRVFGTLQLFLGLLLMVLGAVAERSGGQVLLVVGLLLAASCIVWFGVLDRRSTRVWR
jgi:hypothetical protein